MAQIDIQNEHSYAVNEARLREAAEATLRLASADPDSALTLVLTDDKTVTAMNRRYRGVDAPTDILSFPADAPPVTVEGEPPYLGDLILAWPYASAQAQALGHNPDDSLALLVVHGCLHLLGHDHDSDDARREMWSMQEKILDALGIPRDYLPALEGGADDAGLH